MLDFSTGSWHEVAFPKASTPLSRARRPSSRSASFRYNYQSMVTPAASTTTTWRPHERTLRKRQEVPGYDPAHYATERQWATARDGVKVPLSIVYRKGFKRDGTRAALPLRLRLLRLRHAGRLQQPTGSACSTAAWSTPSPTSAAATRWARPGTTTACS